MWEAHQQQQQHTGSIYCNNTHSTPGSLMQHIHDSLALQVLTQKYIIMVEVGQEQTGGRMRDWEPSTGTSQANATSQEETESLLVPVPATAKALPLNCSMGLDFRSQPLFFFCLYKQLTCQIILNSPLFSSSHRRSVGVKKQTG